MFCKTNSPHSILFHLFLTFVTPKGVLTSSHMILRMIDVIVLILKRSFQTTQFHHGAAYYDTLD